jgi:hypothetical protein
MLPSPEAKALAVNHLRYRELLETHPSLDMSRLVPFSETTATNYPTLTLPHPVRDESGLM